MRLAGLLLATATALAGADLESAALRQLLAVKRVHVDRLVGGETAAQMREMLISSLQGARLFVVTENPDRADTFLRGAAEDLVYTEVHSSSESLSAHSSVGRGKTTRNETRSTASAGVGESESNRAEERRHEALATVRLVDKDGDVIWSTIQESKGAKFRGASADVADKITKQLLEAFEKARKQAAAGSSR
jgi:hypothetical protein